MFKIGFRGSSLYPKQLSLFCLLWLNSADFAIALFEKHEYDVTNIVHKIQMTQYATE